MYSRAHGAISLVVSVVLVALGVWFVHPVATVAYGTAIGVGIDFDHFLMARYNTGNWRALRFLLSNPRQALSDQSTIFEAADLSHFDRLVSHVLIIGVAVPLTWWVDASLGLLTAVVLYAHVLADLIADRRDHNAARQSSRL